MISHRFDLASGCRELQSVETTAAPNNGLFVLAGDATSASTGEGELTAVGRPLRASESERSTLRVQSPVHVGTFLGTKRQGPKKHLFGGKIGLG